MGGRASPQLRVRRLGKACIDGGNCGIWEVTAAGARPGWERDKRKRKNWSLPAIFPGVLLLRLETGTAAKIFFTGKTDFFLVVLVRRVLAFPSGWLLARKVDINLLMSLGGRLRLAVPVCRGKDAEGHGDAGFKVQIGDFCLARESSHNLP